MNKNSMYRITVCSMALLMGVAIPFVSAQADVLSDAASVATGVSKTIQSSGIQSTASSVGNLVGSPIGLTIGKSANQIATGAQVTGTTLQSVSNIIGGNINGANVGNVLTSIGQYGAQNGLLTNGQTLSTIGSFINNYGSLNSIGDLTNWNNIQSFATGAISQLGNLSVSDITSALGVSGLGNLGNLGSLGSLGNLTNVNVGSLMSMAGLSGNALFGSGMSYLKDLSPEIFQNLGQNLFQMDLGSILGGMGGGWPVTKPADTATVAESVSSSSAHTAQAEAQYREEVKFTQSLGQAGNNHFKGDCIIENHDYSAMITGYINGPGIEHEDNCPYLYLDTECWTTVGIGSVLKQYGEGLQNYTNYFLTMDYVDASGNPVDKSIQQRDIERIYKLEQCCMQYKENRTTSGACTVIGDATIVRSAFALNGRGVFNVGCRANTWSQMFGGRHITEESAKKAIFSELCKDHVTLLHNYAKRQGRQYGSLPIKTQEVLLDISYQGGFGVVQNTAWSRYLINGQCNAAANAFSGTKMCTKYSSRCSSRQSMMRSGCTGGQCAGGRCAIQ